MNLCQSCGKKFFAWMMSQEGDIYEKEVRDRKVALFSTLSGTILEIGPGTGVNLPYYPQNIHWIGIEPNPYMHFYLREKAEELGLNTIDLRTGSAENLPVDNNSIDTVISTLVLCSVKNLPQTLQEIRRVLKPGGRFLFIEHIAAPQGTVLRSVQRTVRPIWQLVGDGCHPDRETGVFLQEAGFSHVDLIPFEVPFPVISPHLMGVAVK